MNGDTSQPKSYISIILILIFIGVIFASVYVLYEFTSIEHQLMILGVIFIIAMISALLSVLFSGVLKSNVKVNDDKMLGNIVAAGSVAVFVLVFGVLTALYIKLDSDSSRNKINSLTEQKDLKIESLITNMDNAFVKWNNKHFENLSLKQDNNKLLDKINSLQSEQLKYKNIHDFQQELMDVIKNNNGVTSIKLRIKCKNTQVNDNNYQVVTYNTTGEVSLPYDDGYEINTTSIDGTKVNIRRKREDVLTGGVITVDLYNLIVNLKNNEIIIEFFDIDYDKETLCVK